MKTSGESSFERHGNEASSKQRRRQGSVTVRTNENASSVSLSASLLFWFSSIAMWEMFSPNIDPFLYPPVCFSQSFLISRSLGCAFNANKAVWAGSLIFSAAPFVKLFFLLFSSQPEEKRTLCDCSGRHRATIGVE